MTGFDTKGHQYQDLTLKIEELKRHMRELKVENVILKKQLKTKSTQVNTVTSAQLISFCDSDSD